MQRATICTILTCMLLSAFSAACLATTYYVNGGHPSASDANPGTAAEPLLTLARAVEHAQPGDTVFITGTYHEALRTERSGSAGAPIVFATAPGSSAILDGSTGDPGNNGVVSTHSYLHFEGLEIRGWNENGMWFETSANILIRDCEVHEVTYGIGMTDGCHDFILERVLMHHFDLYGFDASPGNGSCFNGTFIDCVSHTGRDPEQNVDGFALGHGNQHGFLFRNCETYGVYDGFDISSRETTLENCVAHDCANGGYKLWQDEIILVNCIAYRNGVDNVELDWDGNPGSVSLWNCTLHQAETFNIWVENSADTLFMHNCIISGGDLNGLAFELRDTRNYFGDYNVFHNDDAARMINVGYEDQYGPSDLIQWHVATGQDAHSMALSEPTGLYVDETAFDLHLTATSAARDKGVLTGAPVTDFDGNPRPDGSAVDIGAYEYQSSTSRRMPPDVPSLSVQAYPNPGNDIVHFLLRTDRPMPAEIAVYDIAGALLHRRFQHLPCGAVVLSWDGKNAAGISLHGAFVLFVRTPFGSQQQRLILK